jgi:hypothetical protein
MISNTHTHTHTHIQIKGLICGKHGENRNAYRVLLRKPEVKRQLSRPRHGWEDNTKTNRDARCGLDLSHSGQGPVLVNTAMKFHGSIKWREIS